MDVMDAVVPERNDEEARDDEGSSNMEVIYDEPTVEVSYDEPVFGETEDEYTMTTMRRKTTRTKYRIQEVIAPSLPLIGPVPTGLFEWHC